MYEKAVRVYCCALHHSRGCQRHTAANSWFFFSNETLLVNSFGNEKVTLVGKATITAQGVWGNYLKLERDEKTYAKIGNSYAFPGDFSISVWFRTPKGYTDQMSFILSRHDAGYSNGYFLQVNYQNGIGSDGKVTFYYQGNWIISQTRG